jgi:hypothetical protein
MIDRSVVSAHSAFVGGAWTVKFGIYLPGIRPYTGYSLRILVIHEADQFTPTIAPQSFAMAFQPGSDNDLWSAAITIATVAGSNFGQLGKYLYRYELRRNGQRVAPWFSDPFATESGTGTLSAFRIGNAATFLWTDAAYRVPKIDDGTASPRPTINVASAGEWHSARIPSYYGCVYAR